MTDVYLYPAEAFALADRMKALLLSRGLSPEWSPRTSPYWVVSLPDAEMPALRRLQRAEPDTFGNC